jgi:hypothetical protein
MPSWLLVVLIVVAVHRVTRLLVADEIPLVKVPRDAAVNWLDPEVPGRRAPWGGFGRSVAYLIGCPWCMSMWVGAGLVALTTVFVSVPAPLLVWLAASSVTGWAAQAESEHEQRWKVRQQQIEQPEARR